MEQSVGLIVSNAAETSDVFPRDFRVNLDILQHHLFLLNGIKPSLAHIVCGLAHLLVECRAQGIGAPFLAPVSFGQSGFDESFEDLPCGGLVLLDTASNPICINASFLAQQTESDQRVDRQ